MNHPADEPHHPLPRDARSRHDRLPEDIEGARPSGEDDPAAPEPDPDAPPPMHYRNPDGTPYDQ
ncbi:MAG TPA: hypothetical protein VEZ48_11040 [Sphingomonadaceae bacterium]|jgi:hypothetical protein|nr:hypothetical protein [Sphingomonadaceae bacterium]